MGIKVVTTKDDICRFAAKLYANRDWHRLKKEEEDLTDALEDLGYLIKHNPINGFVGYRPLSHIEVDDEN